MEQDPELAAIRARLVREMMAPAAPPLDKPVNVTDADFEAFVRRHALVVVDCWADWCGPCHRIAPTIEALAKQLAGRVVFAKLDVDRNPRVQSAFGVMSLPTLLVFKHGRLVDRVAGALPPPQLAAFVQRHL